MSASRLRRGAAREKMMREQYEQSHLLAQGVPTDPTPLLLRALAEATLHLLRAHLDDLIARNVRRPDQLRPWTTRAAQIETLLEEAEHLGWLPPVSALPATDAELQG